MKNNISGKWNGVYTYGDSYPVEMRGREVGFHLECKQLKGVIIGTCEDEESKNIFEQPASISGVFEDGYISFVKKYPHHWSVDEKRKVRVDKNREAIEVQYVGYLNGSVVKGTWSMSVAYVDRLGTITNVEFGGTWMMKKE